MIYLLLPSYNEERGIKALLDELSRQENSDPLHLVIIDDGSTDGTQKLLRDFQAKNSSHIHLLLHENNQGLGRAFKTGFNYLIPKLEAEDIVITMDADDTHPISLMPQAIQAIHQGADLVIFSRFVAQGGMIGVSLMRRILSLGASILYRTAFPSVGIREFNCGYRAFSGKLLKKAGARYKEDLVQEQGFTANAELFLKLLAFEPKVKELPLILRYDLKQGASKMSIPVTIMSHLKLCLRFLLSTPPTPPFQASSIRH